MKKKRSGLPDILVGLVCFSGALLMGYLFWKDLNRTLIKISEVPVASITYKRNGAQRRFQERLIWGAVQKGSPVYNGDLIRTADLSDAVVTFEAGVKIDLSENSLIQAFYDAGAGLRVELSGGSITVDTEGAGLVVSSGGREVSVSPGSSVSLDSNIETGGLSIKVAEGGALAGTAEGLREIGAGAAMTIAGEGQIEEKPQVTVIFPPANHRILNGEKAPGEVSFAFKTTGFTGAEKVRLDLAEDRRFSRIVQTLEDPSGAALTTRLAPGTWWWRAYAVTEGQAAPSGDSPPPAAVPPDAARGRIYIVYAPGPELRLPAEGERFRYQNAPSESPGGPETRDAAPLILFRWSSRAGDQADAYFLLIADNRELLNPVIAETVEGFSFTSDSLTEGTWYWRVSALYEGGNPDAVPVSGTASFSIVREPAAGAAPPAIAAPAPANEAYRDEAGESPKTPPVNPVRITEKNPSDINISPKAPARPRALPIPLLGRPEALMPAGDSQIDADYILRNPEPRPGPAGEAPFTGMLFRWNSVAGANAYTFSLLREGSAEPLVRSGYSPKTEYLLRDMSFLENGVYVWRVEALRIASNGTTEQRGETGEFRFTLSVPQPGRPVPDNPGTLYGFSGP